LCTAFSLSTVVGIYICQYSKNVFYAGVNCVHNDLIMCPVVKLRGNVEARCFQTFYFQSVVAYCFSHVVRQLSGKLAKSWVVTRCRILRLKCSKFDSGGVVQEH